MYQLREKTAIITTHFNFNGYKTNTDNYYRWKEALPKGVKVFTAELSINGTFELPSNVRFLGDDSNILWQKEALINAAERMIPEEFEYLVWADHDCIMDNPYWLDMTLYRLAYDMDVAQCFTECVYLGKDGKPQRSIVGAVQAITPERSMYRYNGAPGLCWAMRRDKFRDIGGLYVHNVVGGGDRTFCENVMNVMSSVYKKGIPHRLLSHMLVDRRKYRTKRLRVCNVPNKAMHLYHGELKNRQYGTRYKSLVQADFDPLTDVRVDENGLLEWSSDKPEMHAAIKEYFVNRKEDE